MRPPRGLDDRGPSGAERRHCGSDTAGLLAIALHELFAIAGAWRGSNPGIEEGGGGGGV